MNMHIHMRHIQIHMRQFVLTLALVNSAVLDSLAGLLEDLE
jgi:hypothetical protein